MFWHWTISLLLDLTFKFVTFPKNFPGNPSFHLKKVISTQNPHMLFIKMRWTQLTSLRERPPSSVLKALHGILCKFERWKCHPSPNLLCFSPFISRCPHLFLCPLITTDGPFTHYLVPLFPYHLVLLEKAFWVPIIFSCEFTEKNVLMPVSYFKSKYIIINSLLTNNRHTKVYRGKPQL